MSAIKTSFLVIFSHCLYYCLYKPPPPAPCVSPFGRGHQKYFGVFSNFQTRGNFFNIFQIFLDFFRNFPTNEKFLMRNSHTSFSISSSFQQPWEFFINFWNFFGFFWIFQQLNILYYISILPKYGQQSCPNGNAKGIFFPTVVAPGCARKTGSVPSAHHFV